MLHRLIPLQSSNCFDDTHTSVCSYPGFQPDGAHPRHARTSCAAFAQSVCRPIPGAIGPVGTHLVYVSGHDSNLFKHRGIVESALDRRRRTDDTPPDSQIVFELWQNPKSKEYTMRLAIACKPSISYAQGQALTLANPPVEVELTPPGCRVRATCRFTVFDHAAHALLDPAYIKPDLQPTQVVAAAP